MNKEEFLKRLEELLQGVSEEERTDAIAFYRSYFEDAGEGNEASILEELESPEKVAEVIKKNLGVSEPHGDGTRTRAAYGTYGSGAYGNYASGEKKDLYGNSSYGNGSPYGQPKTMEEIQRENQKNKTEKTVLWIILAVLTCPIWITILAVFAAIAVAVLACVFAIAVSILAVMAACVICGFVLVGVGFGQMTVGSWAVGLALLGSGLLILSLGVLAVVLTVWCFGWFIPWAVRKIAGLCKKPFEKRKERKMA